MTAHEFNKHIVPLGDKLFRLAMSLLHDRDGAQDVVQDIMESMWRRRDALSTVVSVEAYVMRSMRNLCLDRLRVARQREEHLHSVAHLTNTSVGAESGFDIKELVERYVSELPEQQRTILHLRDVEGYEFDDIGAILSMESSAVRVALSRARRQIRNKIQNALDYDRAH